MNFCPTGQAGHEVSVVNHLPAAYAYSTYQLKGASVSCSLWKQNAILSQSVSSGGLQFSFYQIHANENMVLTAKVPETITALWFVMKGKVSVCVEGIGWNEFRQGDNLLAYNPAGSLHRIRLQKGVYQFLCLVLNDAYIRQLARVNSQLAYFSGHALSGDCRSLMQLTVPAWKEKDTLIDWLLIYNYNVSVDAAKAKLLVVVLLRGHIQYLEKLMQRRKMNGKMVSLGLAVRAYVDAHYHEGITIRQLTCHFGKSECTIEAAFASITNQTIKRYALEQCLLYACCYLEENPRSVKCCLSKVGMSYSNFQRHYKRRFGCTPSAGSKKASDALAI